MLKNILSEEQVNNLTKRETEITLTLQNTSLEILKALANHRRESVELAAQNILEGWIANTWRNIQNGQ